MGCSTANSPPGGPSLKALRAGLIGPSRARPAMVVQYAACGTVPYPGDMLLAGLESGLELVWGSFWMLTTAEHNSVARGTAEITNSSCLSKNMVLQYSYDWFIAQGTSPTLRGRVCVCLCVSVCQCVGVGSVCVCVCVGSVCVCVGNVCL